MATCVCSRQQCPYIQSGLKPLYNGHLFTMARFFSDPQGGCCGEVQLYINLGSVLELHFMLTNFTMSANQNNFFST